MRYRYNVIFYAHIGKRFGTICLTTNKTDVEGILTILGQSFSFCGTVEDDGKCRICGSFNSPKNQYAYTAVGMFNENMISLAFQVGEIVYKMEGTAILKEDTV
ncbi:MAG: hypothetical protein NC320_11235 [Clostridium sp.]|nr:hypothetical protein [Clostridium sp.]